MITNDLNSKITAAKLNETMFKKFGTKINFEKYTREELENYRNLLRTNIHQLETTSNFNDLLANETYQKDKYMMGVLNTKIKEMLGESLLAKKGASETMKKRNTQEGVMDTVKAVGKKVINKLGHGSDEEMIKDLQRRTGVPQTGKKPTPSNKNTPKESTMRTTEAKKAKKDYDGDGKVESPKDEVWGSRAKAAAKSGKPFKEDTGKFNKSDTTWTDKSGKKHPAQRVTRKVDQLAGGTDDERRLATSLKSKKTGKAMEGSKPDFLDLDKDGNKKEPMKSAAKSKKKVKESTAIFRRHVAIVNESLRTLINEDEEGKAKAITAASDMVNDFTTWMQRVGQYQTKSMIELADSIRGEFGQAESDAFKNAIAPALSATLEVMTQQREAISHAVAVLAGEAADTDQMGGMAGGEVPDMTGGADEFEGPAGDDSMNTGDEFGASDAASGGMETAGRELRESRKREQVRHRIAESQALMAILSQK